MKRCAVKIALLSHHDVRSRWRIYKSDATSTLYIEVVEILFHYAFLDRILLGFKTSARGINSIKKNAICAQQQFTLYMTEHEHTLSNKQNAFSPECMSEVIRFSRLSGGSFAFFCCTHPLRNQSTITPRVMKFRPSRVTSFPSQLTQFACIFCPASLIRDNQFLPPGPAPVIKFRAEPDTARDK